MEVRVAFHKRAVNRNLKNMPKMSKGKINKTWFQPNHHEQNLLYTIDSQPEIDIKKKSQINLLSPLRIKDSINSHQLYN